MTLGLEPSLCIPRCWVNKEKPIPKDASSPQLLERLLSSEELEKLDLRRKSKCLNIRFPIVISVHLTSASCKTVTFYDNYGLVQIALTQSSHTLRVRCLLGVMFTALLTRGVVQVAGQCFYRYKYKYKVIIIVLYIGGGHPVFPTPSPSSPLQHHRLGIVYILSRVY